MGEIDSKTRENRGRAGRRVSESSSSVETGKYRALLEKLVKAAYETGESDRGNTADSEMARLFNTGTPVGRAVYKSFSDQELIEFLRRRTAELGHVPAQKEVFWIHRNYLRMRFDKWPYALKKAGLSTKAGKGGMTVDQMKEREKRYNELMDMVRRKAREVGRPPHMFEMEDVRKELKGWFMTWDQVLDAAGINRNWQQKEVLYRVKNFTDEEKKMLRELRTCADRLGRTPLRTEVPEGIRKKLNKKCGTWRNTLYQIGLEPVMKVSPFSNTYLDGGREQQKKHRDVLENSLFKLVNPDEETKALLAEVRELADRLGRAPIKSEIDSRTYSILVSKCCTYRNLLYQIGLIPLDKKGTMRVQVGLREERRRKRDE